MTGGRRRDLIPVGFWLAVPCRAVGQVNVAGRRSRQECLPPGRDCGSDGTPPGQGLAAGAFPVVSVSLVGKSFLTAKTSANCQPGCVTERHKWIRDRTCRSTWCGHIRGENVIPLRDGANDPCLLVDFRSGDTRADCPGGVVRLEVHENSYSDRHFGRDRPSPPARSVSSGQDPEGGGHGKSCVVADFGKGHCFLTLGHSGDDGQNSRYEMLWFGGRHLCPFR